MKEIKHKSISEELERPIDELTAELDKAKEDGDNVIHLSDFARKSDKPEKTFTTGFSVFNEAMDGGFRAGDLVIISGVSGQGKTSLAQTLTYHLCKADIQTLWFSYEVAPQRLHDKFVSMGIKDFYNVYAPKKNTSGKLDWIKKKILHSMIENKTKVVFIDHIDFLKSTATSGYENEAIALKNITIELKSLAVSYGVIIVLMAHLKKLSDDSKDPTMQDIGYSAGIFQLADYVMMIRRIKEKKSRLDSEVGEIDTKYSNIKIVKNRMTGRTVYQRVLMVNNLFIIEDLEHDIGDII